MTYRDDKGWKATLRKAGWVLLAALMCADAANAQLAMGDNLKMHLNGSLGYSYTGAFGDQDFPAGHGQGLSGEANLSGSYYNPNFLSFSVRPYYDRSQDNSASQFITNGSGIGATVNLFGGSHFPGSVSYSKDFNSSSEFGLPGVAGLLAEGSGQGFVVTWAALLPKWPQLYASFADSSNSSTVLGTSSESDTSTKTFNLNATYRLGGFDLLGMVNHQNTNFTVPDFLQATNTFNTFGGSSTSYGITAQHRLPLSGNFSASWNHSSYGSDSGNLGSGSGNNISIAAGIMPWQKLSVYENIVYSSNLTAALGASVIAAGGGSVLNRDYGSSSLGFNTGVSSPIGHGFSLNGYINHRRQSFLGEEFSDTQYGGTLNYRYAQRLLGMLYFSVGMVDNANQQGNSGLGLVANVGMNRKFGRWDTSADFSYTQSVQTLLVLETNSALSYGGSVRRRLTEDTQWGVAIRAGHSGPSTITGSSSRAESFSSSLLWKRRYAFTGSYSQSSGTTVLTASGLLSPISEAPLITEDFVLFNARSLSVGASARVVGRMTLSGNYTRVNSETLSHVLNSINRGERYNTRLEYRLRKMALIAGFSRVQQEVSAATSPIGVVNSYFLSFSRWFDVF